MDASIITQGEEKKHRTAIHMAGRMWSAPDWTTLYYSRPRGIEVVCVDVTTEPPKCLGNPTSRVRCTNPLDCLHAHAAGIYLAARETVLETASELHIDHHEAHRRIVAQLDHTKDHATRERLIVLRQACQELRVHDPDRETWQLLL